MPNNDYDHGTIMAADRDRLPTLEHSQYTIAWLCALHIEMAAARAMLDSIHTPLPACQDDNTYILGSIKQHNVVIACLPAEGYGTNNAAKVVTNMKRTFSSLGVSLMVGIGGGVPIKHDIRLGDVVVGTRVMQYDLGKIVEDGKFQRTAFAMNPGLLLGTAVSALRAGHELQPSQLPFILQEKMEAHSDYTRPSSPDHLFQATYEHCSPSLNRCDKCDHSKLVPRVRRDEVMIHYGAIASGNQVMKHGMTRDNIARELDIVCFEMEAAGIMDILPCLPIRGICDYSDSHKTKEWQKYAAATAAAYARELLKEIPSITERPVNGTSLIPDPNELSPQERRKLLLQSIRFEGIDSRKLNIKAELTKTCQWLLSHPSYVAWLDPANSLQNHGFLWIVGKPGAGKSTIMKFAYMKRKSHIGSAVTASFFFNARGQYLEKSIIGMYRSLLLQLLEGYPELQTVLDNPELVPPSQIACPSLNSFKNLFRDALFALGQRSFTCFVDALDECDEQQVVDMVQFFEDLAVDTTAMGIPFRICFSSRHYPYIPIRRGIRLTLEDQPGHAEDLRTYISSRLRVEDRVLSRQLQSQLLHKAAGVFMWVVLVVDLLNKESRRGGMALGKRLEQIPSELSKLFKDILTRDNEDMEALLLCILWILYAKKPLQPQEFYHALWSGLSLKGLVDDEIPDTTVLGSSDGLNRINRYVLSSSKGLAETTKSGYPVVQFIHESIRDFLIKDKGLQQIWPEFGFDCEIPGHEKLKECCSLYINHNLVRGLIRRQLWGSGFDDLVEISKQYPFLDYATRHILHHANGAARLVPQDEFLSSFPISDWICASNILGRESYSTSASLIYILADKGFPDLIGTRLKADPQIHVLGERYKYPLFAALEHRHQETTVALLNSPSIHNGADDITGPDGYTPFQWVVIHGSDAIATLFIEKGANVNVADQDGWTPLLRAMIGNREEVMKQLINKGAEINAGDDCGETPLLRAVIYNKEKIARLLINHGANVNIITNGRTLLSRALMFRDGAVAKLLIESGANVNESNKDGRTPLLRALMDGNEQIARLLINKGADVNASNNHAWTPLLQALMDVNEEIVRLLIDNGADVNDSDEYGRTPLLRVLMVGNGDLARLLINKGADINASDNYGWTPLFQVFMDSNQEMARLLIDKGAKISDEDEWAQLLSSLLNRSQTSL
ncbi:Pfs NACHT and ankyrin domain protein [Penicillium frequentans]|uniref:Pfs NACHT and ankyrin domain protein n=1 Tax=Penicillium frequentans TaxID=3151616 RepID=A0AAD6CSQ0_9EURO|nr:Pfs NACHT and ankyrin domain protein [Penicillium glabrum]